MWSYILYCADEQRSYCVTDISLSYFMQFLVRMKIMDYSLLLGIHDVELAEREEEEEDKDSSGDHEEETDTELPPAQGFHSPEGISGYMNSYKPMGPGEFDPYVDVYAIQSAVGKSWLVHLQPFSSIYLICVVRYVIFILKH